MTASASWREQPEQPCAVKQLCPVERQQAGDLEIRTELPAGEALAHVLMVIRTRHRPILVPAEACRHGFRPTLKVTSDG
jgi:hypothetical protein